VVRALKASLASITGRGFETPGDLRDFLKRPEVKNKVKSR
jgi:hypothetical protein